MPFKRFVEVGRVGLITYGPDEGKLCTIINMIDQSHVLIDGTPAGAAGCARQGMALKRIMLTDLKVGIKLNATAKCVAALPALAAWPRCDVRRLLRVVTEGTVRAERSSVRRRCCTARRPCAGRARASAPGCTDSGLAPRERPRRDACD